MKIELAQVWREELDFAVPADHSHGVSVTAVSISANTSLVRRRYSRAAFERTVHDNENQSTKTVDDDIKIGVTMLGMEDMRVKEHFIRNSVRITNWNQMREEIPDITRIQQYIDSQPMPMQFGANPKSKGKGKESKGKGKDIKGKDKAKDVKKIVQESEKRRSEKVLLQQNRSREGRVQTETGRPCRGRRETGGSVATSTRHSSGCAVKCLLPGERHSPLLRFRQTKHT